MEKQWKVVKFNHEKEDGGSVEVVPLSWLEDTDCLWPPFESTKDVESAIKHCLSPEKDQWLKYTGVEISTKTFDKFSKASAKANKVAAHSDLDTNSEPDQMSEKRRITKNPLYANRSWDINESSEDEDENDINSKIPEFPNFSASTKSSRSKDSKKTPKDVKKTKLSVKSGTAKRDIPNNKKIDRQTLKDPKFNNNKCSSSNNSQKLSSQLTPDLPIQNNLVYKKNMKSVAQNEVADDSSDSLPSDIEEDIDGNTHNAAVRADRTVGGEQYYQVTESVEMNGRDDNNNDNEVLKKLVKQTIMNNKLIKQQNYLLKDLISKLTATGLSGLRYLDPDEEVLSQQFKNTFPIKDEDNLLITNNLLSNDEKFNKYAVQIVSLEGGHTISECVRKVLPIIIDDTLANAYSFKGHKLKRNFSLHKNIVLLIVDSVRTHVPNATTKHIEDQIAVWLTKAKRRMETALQE